MHLFQWQVADVGVQLIQVRRLVRDAGQVQVLLEKLRCRFPKCPLRPNPEYHCLPGFLNPAGEYQFRRFEVACSSAFVNLVSEDLLFDMPDPATIPEPWSSLSSHNVSPLSSEVGRPLQDL